MKPRKEYPTVRVLMVFTILNRGGAETMVMNYLRAIDRSRVIFDFLVHRPEKGAYEDEIEQLGGKIFRLPAIQPTKLKSYKRAVSLFFDTHPEYNMIHGHCSELGYYIYREAHRRGFAYIAAHAHNYPQNFDIKTPVRNTLKHLMRPFLTHRFTCGKKSAEWLFGKKLAEDTIFLPNAIDAHAFSYERVRQDSIRSKYGWNGKFVLGNVARFSSQKNHLFLLEIFSHILRKQPSSLLVLVGSGGDMEQKVRDTVRSMGITENVLFMGSRTDIADLLQGFDIFLFPSKFEGLSVSQLEAQAAGVKIVNSTSIPREGAIIPELVKSVSLKRTADNWADIVLQNASDYDRKDRSKEVVNAGFDIKDNAQWLQEFYIKQSRS